MLWAYLSNPSADVEELAIKRCLAAFPATGLSACESLPSAADGLTTTPPPEPQSPSRAAVRGWRMSSDRAAMIFNQDMYSQKGQQRDNDYGQCFHRNESQPGQNRRRKHRHHHQAPQTVLHRGIVAGASRPVWWVPGLGAKYGQQGLKTVDLFFLASCPQSWTYV